SISEKTAASRAGRRRGVSGRIHVYDANAARRVEAKSGVFVLAVTPDDAVGKLDLAAVGKLGADAMGRRDSADVSVLLEVGGEISPAAAGPRRGTGGPVGHVEHDRQARTVVQRAFPTPTFGNPADVS